MQRQQQMGGLPGNDVSNAQNNSTDSSIMSSLLQGLAGALNQQQQQQQQQQSQNNNGMNGIMSLLASQQLGQMSGGGNGLDLSRLAGSGLFGNLQGSGSGDQQQSNQALNLASLLNSQQGKQTGQNQDQALALARLAGARLLSGDGSSNNEQDNLSLSRQKALASDNASPFISHRKTEPEEAARGNRNLEPGAIAVPCRARGMPMDHNPLTAYFVINKNIQHGEDVVCSHPACRNAGVKFRYCSFCKAPVAKRNFRRRHNHGGDTSAAGSEDMDDESAKVSTVSATSSRRLISASEEEPEAKRAKTISSEDDDVDTTTDSSKSSDDNADKNKCQNPPQQQAKQTNGDGDRSVNKNEAAQPAAGEADSSTATIKASGKSISQERREEWAKLLEERPITNDAESMSKWIDKILKVSDAGQHAKSSFNDAIRQSNALK